MRKTPLAGRRMLTLVILFGLLLGAALAGAAAFRGSPVMAQISAQSDDDTADDGDDALEGPDTPITGPALDRASNAALNYIGEGRVTDTEVGDEEGYYEVEITRPDGREVDVHLDQAFNVLGHEDE